MKEIVKFRPYISTIIFIVLFLSSLTSAVYPQSTQIENGLNFLNYTQNQSGSWGSTPESITNEFLTTVEVLLLLEEVEIANTSAYQNGLLWIQNRADINTAHLAKRIQVLSTLGQDQITDISMLSSYRNLNGGWGGYQNIESGNFHTTLALQTLKAVNYSDQAVIQSAIDYLLSTQNTDGGFGFYSGDESNVYMTALVSSTLQQFPQTTSIATAINKTTSFLIAHQNTDGGFATSTGSGQGESTVFETAYAYMALISETTDATVLGSAINYLTSTQLPNGSWEDDPYSTALALRALANVKPNLSISSSDIIFSNPTPTVGETITITANFKNTGPSQADNILVQFYDGELSSGDFRNYKC
jgi:squalene cyclase